MSQRIGQFVNWKPRDTIVADYNLHLHSNVGGSEGGNSISFIIDGKHVRLTERQLYRLVETIQRRMCCDDDYTATGTEKTVEIVLPDGERIRKDYLKWRDKEYVLDDSGEGSQ